jgi:DNA polymerase-1
MATLQSVPSFVKDGCIVMEYLPDKIKYLARSETIRKPKRISAVDLLIDELVDSEKRVNLILEEMEKGFRVDVHALMNLKRSYESTLLRLNKEMQEKLGKALRVNSNRELGDLLFHDFSLPSLRRTSSGKPSVAIDVLERLCNSYSDVYPFLRSVIGLRKVQALTKSVKTVPKKLDLQGRIHPEFNHSTCPTGRIYSYIQNIPKDVRKVLIPDEEGNVFVELDWCQQEQ